MCSTRGTPLVPTNVNTIIEKTLSNLKFEIAENRDVIILDTFPTVSADRTQLIQLFQNLIVNALKYRSKTPHIHISAERIALVACRLN
jgi:light-regulated signal transduction histidine kinase (bacteriophytochrome)